MVLGIETSDSSRHRIVPKISNEEYFPGLTFQLLSYIMRVIPIYLLISRLKWDIFHSV